MVEDVEADDLISIVPAFRKLGIELDVFDSSVRVPAGQRLHIEDDFGGQIPKIESGIWPAFPADLTSIAVVATQARGTILIFEKMFESRLFFVDKLVSMGARIILCDPHRVVVTGPTLYGERLESPDIRAGMAMVIAALMQTARRSEISARSIAATSGWTSAFAVSGPRSSGLTFDGGGAAQIVVDRPGEARSRRVSPCSTTCWGCSPRRRLRRQAGDRPGRAGGRSGQGGAALGGLLSLFSDSGGRYRGRRRGARDGRRRSLGRALVASNADLTSTRLAGSARISRRRFSVGSRRKQG